MSSEAIRWGLGGLFLAFLVIVALRDAIRRPRQKKQKPKTIREMRQTTPPPAHPDRRNVTHHAVPPQKSWKTPRS